jgi:O-antigen/teichoic acid export membrane protein
MKKERFKNLLPRSEFSKNVLTLMTGTTVAQAVPIAISPILTRIYTPEDFGLLALFIAITSIFGSIANGRYELAVMLPKKDENAINILALGVLIVTLLSLFLLILVVFFNVYFTKLLGNEEISVWLYFVPITVFFMGLFNMLNYFNNRKKYYKDIAKATVVKSVALTVVQLGVGLLKAGVTGLISGQIMSHFASNLKLLKNVIQDKNLLMKINKSKMLSLGKRYKRFPQFSMWGILLNTSSIHLSNMLISLFYGVTTLGIYSLVQKVLGAPISLIGNSVGQVFFQQATKEKNDTGKAIISFNKTIKKLFLLGVPIFISLFFVVEYLFAFVFGDEWKVAGVFAKTLVPLYFIRFIVVAVSNVTNIFELQKLALIWQFTLFSLAMLTLLFCDFYSLTFEEYLFYFMVLISINYLVLYFILKRVCYKGKFI